MERKHQMKNFRKIIFVLAVVMIITQVSAYAAVDTTSGASSAATPTPAPTQAPTKAPTAVPTNTPSTVTAPEATPVSTSEPTAEPTSSTTDTTVSIAPDSALYPLKLMLESISVSLTFDENNKAVLLVKYANRRLAEAEIMKSEDNVDLAKELVQECIDMLEEANSLVEGSDEGQAELVKEILVDISETGEEVSISLQFMLAEGVDQEDIDKLLQQAEEEVVKTIVTNAFLTSKDNFFDAKEAFKLALEEYKRAKASGDADAIQTAYNALVAAEALKDELEAVKDEAEIIKDQVIGDEDNHDEGEGKALGHDKNKHDYDIGGDKYKDDDRNDNHDDDDHDDDRDEHEDNDD